MRPMFAQGPGGLPVQPTGHELLVWMGVAVLVLAGVAFAIGLFNQAAKAKAIITGKNRQAEITPQPLDVRMVHDLVKKDECMARHSESLTGLASVRRDVDELRRERKQDATELHEKINKVAIQVGGLEKSTEMQNRQLQSMDAKLDRLVERRVERM